MNESTTSILTVVATRKNQIIGKYREYAWEQQS